MPRINLNKLMKPKEMGGVALPIYAFAFGQHR